MVDFATDASHNGVSMTQQMCHIMIYFHDYFMMKVNVFVKCLCHL
jgi:hypothetical protein